MWAWPRDMWIGRTYAETESSYPTSGDTFRVQLLSAHFTGSEGTQAVTEHERGTIVTARTWPEAYLPYGTDVIVKRIRGIGPNGAGEWWIEPTGSAGGSPILYYGSWDQGRNEINVLTDQMQFSGSLAKKLWFSGTSTAGSLFASAAVDAPRGTALLTCEKAGRYMFWTRTVWHLYTITPSAYEEWNLSYWTAPSTVVYPVFGLHGSFLATAFTRLDAPGGSDPAGFPEGGKSSLVVRSNGSATLSYARATHYGHHFRELEVGDRVDLSVEWAIDTPLDRTVTTYPQAELDEVSLAAIYCGSAGNV